VGYLKRARGRAIVVSFIVATLVFAAFPQIDIFVSGLFYGGSFSFSGTRLQQLIRDATTAFLCLSVIGAIAVYLFNRMLRRNLWNMDGKRVCYLLVVLALGAGLIVNLAFKDNFGRARPRDVAEFGGDKTFTPVFAMSRECRENCSFSSGEAAAGFFSIAVVYAVSRRRRAALTAALGFGVVVSAARIASGAHFLSDTVVSFFVMLLLADALHHYMRLATSDDELQGVPQGALARVVTAGAATSAAGCSNQK
jgi:lipid A 4'-phosphatase